MREMLGLVPSFFKRIADEYWARYPSRSSGNATGRSVTSTDARGPSANTTARTATTAARVKTVLFIEEEWEKGGHERSD